MIEQLWVVYVNTDLTEGRGSDAATWTCLSEATALRLAKGAGVQGSDATVGAVEVARINGLPYVPWNGVRIERPTPVDEFTQKRLDARRAAVAKAKQAGLTDADIRALGEGK